MTATRMGPQGRAAALLGLALGGFFDGILLHQILQWHHLLSGVQAVHDLRLQLLADGLFHALMYGIAAVALWLLWRSRALLSAPGAARHMVGWALLGFASWHALDALLSHWLLGIHRIRMDASQPLVWDVMWLLLFGVLPAIAGWRLLRHGGGSDAGGGSSRRGRAAAVTLSLTALLAGGWATLPPRGIDTQQSLVVFGPGVSASDAVHALARVDARLIGSDGAGGMWVVALPEGNTGRQLYRDGAWWVAGGWSSAVCAGWVSRAPQL